MSTPSILIINTVGDTGFITRGMIEKSIFVARASRAVDKRGDFSRTIKKMFARANVNKTKKILVVNGASASFTFLRIGLLWANFLAHFLRAPLYEVSESDYRRIIEGEKYSFLKLKRRAMIIPSYDRAPNITIKKRP
ncbi:MAG: hypothetical protein HYW78_00600 [Parcubacteria group bacterium]|nr:hypothetical protein [Parcubacteria group bacterium]